MSIFVFIFNIYNDFTYQDKSCKIILYNSISRISNDYFILINYFIE